jgi:hypothetical protein
MPTHERDADESDVEALGGQVAALLEDLADRREVETDRYDTVFECYLAIGGKRFNVTVEPDGRAASVDTLPKGQDAEERRDAQS